MTSDPYYSLQEIECPHDALDGSSPRGSRQRVGEGMSVFWQRTFGHELAHAYDSDHAIMTVCGKPVTLSSQIPSRPGDRACRRCLAILGSRRTREAVV